LYIESLLYGANFSATKLTEPVTCIGHKTQTKSHSFSATCNAVSVRNGCKQLTCALECEYLELCVAGKARFRGFLPNIKHFVSFETISNYPIQEADFTCNCIANCDARPVVQAMRCGSDTG
jgi:hypothetical protein